MKFLVFLGSVRDSTPPKPARLGERVAEACLSCLQGRYREHQFELVDALDYSLGTVFKPHFAYAKSQMPADLDSLAEKIKQSDGYIMVSPEYNHSMSLALSHLLNHFGSSLFSYKPSAIVTYSAGQWGGMRAAVAMRTFLSELGCLSVSSMIHIPKAQDVFAADGAIQEPQDQDSWFDYFTQTFNQLMWWAEATHQQRQLLDPLSMGRTFKRSPSERNAP
ncbi:NAD(P)H-dependent oxidoreductase [Psychromonas sp. 14N.309.X.WAT.B.A12]|uniref:NADPH-dependent FMN reductase n=1 Tax=Psychromonas sp. 14N.309.X.WAT.B.A12 TaxID=2998322 RepID=UPI0025B0240E|nr:NAD(P)H-dependent oxidoreductase [Psychromonas sp. 14N.309.X.WAT.B.A12]MDN2661980.1 NAD(P)H-dependent oxidoreductase [Psychromonas sp. 14N.309.X.WAT.B.A12]